VKKLRLRKIVVPMAVFMLLALITVLVWQRDVAHKREIFKNHIASCANDIARGLEFSVDNHTAVLEAFKDRWLDRTDRSQERFEAFADIHTKRFPDFEAIYYVDHTGVVRWVVPSEGNEAAICTDLHDHPNARYFVEVEQSLKTGSTGVVKLAGGGVGFSVCVPVVGRGKAVGYINGILRVHPLVARQVAKHSKGEFHLHLIFGKDVILSTGEATARARDLYSVNMPLRVVNQRWRLELLPGQELEARMKTVLPLISLFLGLLMSAGLGLLIFFLIQRIEQHIQAKGKFSDLYLYNRALIEASLDPLVTFDKKGLILDVNEAMIRATGKRREKLVGTPFEDYFTDSKRAHEGVQEVFKAGKVKDYELVMKGRDKAETVVLYNASVYKDQNGKIVGAFAAARDVTEQKRAEEALAQKAEELARSNAELQQFAYVASHDLQEPLRMVASYTQLLARRYKGRLDSDADEFIAYAVDGVTRMQELIHSLLTYSRVGTRGKDLEPTDCEAVLDRTLANLKMTIEESGADVTHDALPTVMADDVQLGQLFQNLIGNAIKFRNQEPLHVHVSATSNAECGMRNAEWTECGVRSAECWLRILIPQSALRNPQSKMCGFSLFVTMASALIRSTASASLRSFSACTPGRNIPALVLVLRFARRL
jgi:PAS domain S-box-containing protein